MADIFYGLPLWQSTILILGLSLAVGLGCSVGVRKILRLNPSDDEAEVAINLMQVASAYIGIMLAFAAVSVWQDYQDAQTAVHQEAATASELYRDLTMFGPETVATRQALRGYMTSIVKDEWPLLGAGTKSPATEAALERLYAAFGTIQPQGDRDSAIYSEAFSKMNDLVVMRRDRVTDSQVGIPAILWVVGLVGSILTIAYAAAFSHSRLNLLMIAGISLTIGLLFLFLLTVDNPFKGPAQIDSAELAQLSRLLDHIDRSEMNRPLPSGK
jgi:hypothetical protein